MFGHNLILHQKDRHYISQKDVIRLVITKGAKMFSRCSLLKLSHLVPISLLYKTEAAPGMLTLEEYTFEHLSFCSSLQKQNYVTYILGQIRHPLRLVSGTFKNLSVAFAGWLSGLECQPVHQNIVGSIPGQGTYVGCRFDSQLATN